MNSSPRSPARPRAAAGRAAGIALVVVVAVAVAGLHPFAAPRRAVGGESTETEGKLDSSEEVVDYFTKGPIPKLKIVLAPAEYAKLQADAKTFVHAALKEGEKTVFADVGVKLKGSLGSFRQIDDRPGLTVKVDKFVKEQAFHGLVKFHLNNSVQDPTFLDEFVGCEVFRIAGLPAPMVSHARVSINERDLGLYVMKEGYDERFVRRRFKDPTGNLYDGGFAQDIDADLDKNAGKDPDDRSDLQELLAACKEPDATKAHAEIEKHLDVDEFLAFMALERMLCHWDGYCMNRNNYRLYIPKNGRAVFIAHGMDQLLMDPQASILDDPSAIVAIAVMKDAAWHAAYRKKVVELLPIFTRSEKLDKRIDEESRRVLSSLGGGSKGPLGAQIKGRIAARAKNLVEQSASPGPRPLAIEKGGAVRIVNWRPVAESGGPKLAQVVFGGERVLQVDAAPSGASVGSWQTRVFLGPGKYRFEATVMTDDVAAADGPPKGGAGLRVSGVADAPRVEGANPWKATRVEFEVADQPRNVDLAFELRATRGKSRVRVASLRLARVD